MAKLSGKKHAGVAAQFYDMKDLWFVNLWTELSQKPLLKVDARLRKATPKAEPPSPTRKMQNFLKKIEDVDIDDEEVEMDDAG